MDMNQINVLLVEIMEHKKAGVTGASMVYYWMGRRIQPLQKQVRFGFKYLGVLDPSRFTADKIAHGVTSPVIPSSLAFSNGPSSPDPQSGLCFGEHVRLALGSSVCRSLDLARFGFHLLVSFSRNRLGSPMSLLLSVFRVLLGALQRILPLLWWINKFSDSLFSRTSLFSHSWLKHSDHDFI